MNDKMHCCLKYLSVSEIRFLVCCVFVSWFWLLPSVLAAGFPNHPVNSQEDGADTFKQLMDGAVQFRETDPLKARKFAMQALEVAQTLQDDPKVLEALVEVGSLYKRTGNPDSATILIKMAIELGRQLPPGKTLAKSILQFGVLLRDQGEIDSAIACYGDALDIYRALGDSTGIAKVYNSYGIIYKIKGVYDSAAYFYLEAITIHENRGEADRVTGPMINLGKVYLLLGDYENAREYLLKSIEYATAYEKLGHLVIAYTNLGMLEYEEKNFEQALEYYNLALPICDQIHDMASAANLLNNIGNIYFEQLADYQQAYQHYNKALSIHRELDRPYGMLVNLMNIAVIHEQWGNYTRALMINDSCLKLAVELGESGFRKQIYHNLFSVYYNQKNYEKALEYHILYQELNDSLFNLEKTEAIADLTLRYEKEKYLTRILNLENENLKQEVNLRTRTNQRNTYLTAGSGLVLVLGFLILFYRQKNQKDRIIASQRIQQLEEEKNLLAARSIVEGQEEERKRIAKELHDGLGVLLSSAKMHFNTLKVSLPENKSLIDKAAKILEQATGDVRRISHNMMPGLLTKYGFFEALLDLFEQLDDIKGLHAELVIEGSKSRLPETMEIMLYRIVQEMVNNTLKHANAKNILLKVQVLPVAINGVYIDDGKGFDPRNTLSNKSIGLTSIHSRIRYLGGEVYLKSSPGEGITYKFEVPLG